MSAALRSSKAVTEPLVGSLLQSVSRSFYLSIRFLPSGLQEPIGLAYLLARATDTIADTGDIPGSTRNQALKTLVSIIQGNPFAPEALNELRNSIGPLQTDPAERELIERLPQCLQALDHLDPIDRRDIRGCLEKINKAQALDLER